MNVQWITAYLLICSTVTGSPLTNELSEFLGKRNADEVSALRSDLKEMRLSIGHLQASMEKLLHRSDADLFVDSKSYECYSQKIIFAQQLVYRFLQHVAHLSFQLCASTSGANLHIGYRTDDIFVHYLIHYTFEQTITN